VGKPEGKRSLGRTRRRWVDNIKRDLGIEPSGSMICWEIIEWPNIYWRFG
jgi:hypothetical protein